MHDGQPVGEIEAGHEVRTVPATGLAPEGILDADRPPAVEHAGQREVVFAFDLDLPRILRDAEHVAAGQEFGEPGERIECGPVPCRRARRRRAPELLLVGNGPGKPVVGVGERAADFVATRIVALPRTAEVGRQRASGRGGGERLPRRLRTGGDQQARDEEA